MNHQPHSFDPDVTEIIPVETLLSLVDITEARVTVPLPAGMEQPFALLHKVRGALGVALRAGACDAPDEPECAFDDPCAWHVLWKPQGLVRPGRAMPAPFVLLADVVGGRLEIAIRLFGFSGACARDVADALVRALRGRISLSPPVEFKILDRSFGRQIGLRCAPITSQVVLETRTPLLLRNGRHGHLDPKALLRGMVHRTDALARLHGFRLGAEAAKAALASVDLIEGVVERRGDFAGARHSRRQGRDIPIEGALAHIAFQGDLAPMAPYLTACEYFFAGSHTAFGQGRFRITHAV